MAKFLTGIDLEETITDIIHEAEETLFIVSPFIKLDPYFKKIFREHLESFELHIILIFGKNDGDFKKSLSIEDLDFFKQFPNISVIYVKNLHAKYYGNERKGVTTSINLYDYSFKNNIEFGVYREASFVNSVLNGNFDAEVFDYCFELTEKYPAIFIKRPIIQKGMLGFTTKYLGSEILCDQTPDFLKNRLDEKIRMMDFESILNKPSQKSDRKISREEFDQEEAIESKKLDSSEKPPKYFEKPYQKTPPGYCIRTGVPIDFNPERPLSRKAYQTWNQFGDPYYQENFCHFTGEPSFGETCVAKPVLGKNWKNAMKMLGK
jgi:hypothetical protein